MDNRQEQHNTIFELWDILLQYKWRFILPAFIITSCVLAIGFILPRKYNASAQFERRTDMVLTEISTKGASRSFQDPKSVTVEEIKGDAAIDEMIKTIKPQLSEHGLYMNDSELATLRYNVTMKGLVRYDIATKTLDRVRVEYIDPNPVLAQLVVNTLIDNYINRSRELMNGRLKQTASFFDQEVENNRQLLETYENDVLDFEINHSELLPENPNNIQSKIAALQETLTSLISEREAASAKVAGLKESIINEPMTKPSLVMGRNPELKQLEGHKQQLQKQYTQYTSVLKMKARHPDLVALISEIKTLDQVIEDTPKEIVLERRELTNQKLAELELRLTTAQGELDAYNRQTKSMKEQLAALQNEESKIYEVRSSYLRLKRQVAESQRQISFWEDNLRRVELAMAAESGNKGIQLAFIKPASVNNHPVSPNWSQLIFAAVGLGIFCGVLNVFVSYKSDESFADGENAANYCDLQLFGGVSEIISAQQVKVRKLRNLILYPTNAVIMGIVLLSLSTLLYLDLEKPLLFKSLVSNIEAFISPEKAIASEPNTSIISVSNREDEVEIVDIAEMD